MRKGMGHCGWKNLVFMHSLEYVKIKLVSEGKNELMELIKCLLKIREWKVPCSFVSYGLDEIMDSFLSNVRQNAFPLFLNFLKVFPSVFPQLQGSILRLNFSFIF